MLQPLPNPEPYDVVEVRYRWAVIDLAVFGLVFVAAMVAFLVPLSGLPITYLIPIQGLFDAILVGFAAFWIRVVRHRSFKEFVGLYRNRTFKRGSLILLGAALALSVTVISAFLPSTGPSPLEKLLTTKSAILIFGIFGVAVAPPLEEIIFRGFLYQLFSEIGSSRIATGVTAAALALLGVLFTALTGKLTNVWQVLLICALIYGLREILGARVTIVLTAALFAALHAGQLAGNWGYVFLIFVVGCILAVIRERSNSIFASALVHMSYNSTLFLLFALSTLVQKLTK
jgi:CAAX protease family protein